MPSFFDQWLPVTKEKKADLLERTGQFCKASGVKAMGRLASDSGFTNLPKWLRQQSGHQDISDGNYAKLVLQGLQEGWLGRDDRSLFRSLSAFLGHAIPSGAPIHSGTNRTEHFEVFRYSFLVQGQILRGAMSITYGTEEIRVEETYRIQASVAKAHGLGDKDQWFPRTGLLFPRSQDKYLLISQRNASPNEVQLVYLDRVAGGVFRGPFSDWHGADFYAARMHVTPVAKPMHKDHIMTVNPTEIPFNVDRYLTAELRKSTFVVALN